jgi:hypothetical protein
MAQINKPNTHFNSVLYTGNGSTQSITGVNFQPDLVWLKNRNSTNEHCVTDVVRGATKYLHTNLTQAETTASNSLQSFDSDGFTLGTNANFNTNTNTYVAWNWLAGGTAVSNTQGSITSSVSANTTSGFSIVSYTGDASVGSTIGHGLGVAPKVVIIKNRSVSYRWVVGHNNLTSWDYYLSLNESSAETNANNPFNDTAPSSTVVTLGNNTGANGSGESMIAYCFAEKKGFSKFDKYFGNGSTDGPFVYTGFKPAWLLVKRNASATNWKLLDNKRDAYNDGTGANLNANTNDAEDDNVVYAVDFLSNGFKMRNVNSNFNATSGGYIYMAFAENPLVGTNNIPATAR